MNARELALNCLYQIEVGEAYANLVLEKELSKSDLPRVDKALTSELVYGVLTWKLTLDAIIMQYSSIKQKKISDWILNILRLGVYQIVFLDKIPVSAAVNESVKLAKRYGHEASAKFVNAILHRVSKNEMETLLESLKHSTKTDEEKLSILTSHPLWMVELLCREYPKKFVTELLNANNLTPEITIRVNTLRTTREEVKKLLDLKQIDCRLGNLPDSILVKKLQHFDEQLYVVQDEAAQLACLWLDPQEKELVLDACAAPGGKTSYLAQLMNGTGRIEAWDIHEHRVKQLQEMAQRMGMSNIHARVNDASQYQTQWHERFDRVLLDVPCSGLGVIRKKPDVKWKRKEEDLTELIEIQKQILETCSAYVKPGGTVVYSTCTVVKEENEKQVQAFLQKHKEFQLVKEVNLFPHRDGTDGFYIAKLQKQA